MKSNFFEQVLNNSGFSIREFVRGSKTEFLDSQVEAAFDNIMCRAQAAMAFKEFFKQSLSEIKMQQKLHQSRVILYLTRGSEKGKLEKQKLKYIG